MCREQGSNLRRLAPRVLQTRVFDHSTISANTRIIVLSWSRHWGSNPTPRSYQERALPAEL